MVGVNVSIVEGGDDSSLNKGAWHRPGTGNPENGGNMVITGHRFQYLPPNNITFYHLDKMRYVDVLERRYQILFSLLQKVQKFLHKEIIQSLF